MLKAKAGIGRDLLIRFRKMIMKSVRVVFLDPKKDYCASPVTMQLYSIPLSSIYEYV